jgi:hypothetical protein
VDLLAAKLREIPAARVVVILDCHDPGSAKDQKSRTPTMAAAAAFQELAELVAAPGRAVIASFQSTSSSSMSPAADEFAQRLLAGLAGKAMRADGTVGVLDLFGCISTRSSFSETSLRIFKAGDMESNFVVAAGRPSEPSASLAIPAFVDRARLCRMILDAFTPLEFEALCVAIAELLHRDGRTDPFSHSIIEGNAIEDRVGNLIDYLEQRQLVEYLVRAIAGEQRDQITAREPALAVVRVPESSASRSVILFLAANPSGTTRLRLDEECAGIELELSMSAAREDFDLRSKWAVTVDDMMRHLAALQPVIIHFSGHGHDGPGSDVNGQRLEPSSQRDVEAAPEAGIYLQGEHRQPMLVSARALAQMFASAASSTRIVVLNACFSDALAESLCSVVDCVVGMRGAVDDDTARSFAASFYRALGNRSSVANAVDQAIATLAAKQLPGEHLPVCRTRPGVQAERVFVSSLEARRSWLRLSQRYP